MNGDERGFNRWNTSEAAETQGEPWETNPDERSMAVVWAEEPEWQGEAGEALSETAEGNREPEDPAD